VAGDGYFGFWKSHEKTGLFWGHLGQLCGGGYGWSAERHVSGASLIRQLEVNDAEGGWSMRRGYASRCGLGTR
jgi:hypothetical protein